MTKSRSDKGIILIVDDQPENLQILTAILAEQDYEVQQALNGRLALKAAQESPPDLILLDVRLPDMSGYEVCERMKAGESTHDIPIIFVSVVGETEDKIKAFAAGGVDYMTKPLQVEEVLARVETHLALRAMQKQLEEKNAQLEREVDERKRAEEALRNSQEQLELITDKMPVLLAYVNSEQRYLYVNQPYADWYGRSKEDIIGKRVKDILAEASYRGTAKHIKAVLKGQAASFENVAYNLDGQMRAVRAAYVPHFDEDGAVKAFLSVVEDITEQKSLEESLEKERRELELIIDSSPIIIFYKDKEGRFIRVNKTFAKALEMPEEDFVGKTVFDLYAPKIAQGMTDDDQEVLQSRRPKLNIVEQYESASGTRWVQTDKIPICDKNGTPVGLIGFAQDITERRRADEALRESEELFEKTFASQRDAIFILDAANPPTILDCNPAATVVFGYTRQEVLGRTTGFLHVGEAGLRGFQEMLYPAIAERGFLHLPEFHMKRKDGVVFPTEHTVVPLKNERGERIGWISVVRDIAERKQLEEQLRQQERLAAIGQLAGGIAHDFNNLLTSIMLYAQILKSKPDFPPDLAPNVETILDESRHAAKLVQQILDFGRRSMIETRSVDLVPLVEKTADILRSALPENIHLVLDIGTGEHSVHADPTRIQQVVMNLATNARDAMPEGGELRIGLSRMQVKREKDAPLAGMPVSGWVCLAVSDTGMGMTEDVRQHLFEPFFTTKPPGEGTGLGLAQVYGIVKQHEGHIGVETEAGCGTTFRVYLPIHRGATGEATHETVVLPRGRGETILLVEDEERLRKVGREILESLGYRVLTAKDGHEALDAYRSAADIDLVITDLVMPVMGGVQLIQELKKVDPRVKALAITGYALTADKRELREAGLLDIVHKPFDAGTLGETVRRILDSAR
jgi:two-component system cell cycle sensor histidine kinase/response regulator CckA